ncbi:MAG: NADPH-dependent assimilatory sulfite reductase hemoprotein subunit, partial [Actinomycetota bacterium]
MAQEIEERVEMSDAGEGGTRSKVELIKEGSDYLRGTLREELATDATYFSEEDVQILKFHGIYQQDDRDLRQQLKREGKEKYYSCMIRCKNPGGVLTPEQYLAEDEVASLYANGSLRITTRQDFQLHGVLKQNLKDVLRAINEKLITTLGACGDVERNVMCCPAPAQDRVHYQIE